MNKICVIDSSFFDQIETSLCSTLLVSKDSVNDSKNADSVMQKQNTYNHQKDPTFLYLNMFKPLQLITTTVLNE